MNRILSLILALNVSFTAIPLAHPGPGKGSPNRLVHEKSPYLLQHAYNPVNWYPWGEEAFSKAAEEDKPIFLSIGYSTCHWCHVMEKESFSNQETADLLNEDYVAIKVDREERPDIDSVYMNAVMKMTGSGGWPLTVILTPERKPFWGGTYFPPEDKNNRPGLKTILQNITAAWRSQREALIEDAETLTARLHPASDSMASMTVELDSKILDKAFDQLKNSYDSIHGGFGRAPKFPRPHNLLFLMRYWKQTQNPKALEMVEKTLQTMASGGIRDHLGGGFHRYSTDAKWRVPHFEKMLYDQALIAQAYLEAYQITQNSLYAEISRETLDYVLDKLTSPESGFYSAEDADSALTFDNKEKKEGAFYLWNAFELRKILPERDQELIFEHYGIEENGNIETDPHGEFDSRNLLYVSQNLAKLEKRYQKTRQEITEILEKAKSALKSQRETRPKPFLDDKILTDWNGLMIASFAVGARVLKENRYEKAARQAADFILKRMKGENGRLRHRYRTGEAAIEGFLDDYAFLSYGLLELYQTTFEPDYLEQALALAKIMMDQFWDEENGGFYLTSKGSEELITRSKELYDGAIPSGNSVAALVLLQANRLTMEDDFESKARQIHTTFSEALSGFPAYFTFMLIALDFMLGPSREIVIAGDPLEYETRQFIAEVFKHYLPKKVVALHEPFGKNKEAIEELVPFIESQVPINGKPTVYVCKNYVCDLPTTKVEQLKKLLAG